MNLVFHPHYAPSRQSPVIYTPWGPSQHQTQIAPGLISHSCAGHGGIQVTPEKLAQMPADCRSITPWAETGWYEEDCDWAIVCLAFPEHFTADHYKIALQTCATYDRAKHLCTPDRLAKANLLTPNS